MFGTSDELEQKIIEEIVVVLHRFDDGDYDAKDIALGITTRLAKSGYLKKDN